MNKKLFRLKDDRLIAGVCGGIAKYYTISPTLVRALAVFLLIANGLGGIAYVICWVAIPENAHVKTRAKNKEESVEQEKSAQEQGDHNLVWSLILIIFGVFFLIQNFYPQLNLWRLWPIGLILVGVQMLKNNKNTI